jgi:hypothetical protein
VNLNRSELEPKERAEMEAPPSAAEPAAERRAKKKREPVTTLMGFFGRRSANPKSFLKDLREADRWGFEEDDVRDALEIHAEGDKDFGKTTRLIAAAMKERDARFARPAVAFGERAIQRRLAVNPHSIGVDLDAADDPETRLELVTRMLATRLREPKHRAESVNLLLATTLCLRHAGGLLAEAAIERLIRGLSIEPARSSDRQRAQLVWLGEHAKEVPAVLEFLAPWTRRADQLSATVGRLETDVDAEREGRLAAESEIERLATLVSDLERTLVGARAEIEKLAEISRAAEVHADHDVKRVKARIAGLLEGRLQDLVVTIDEALSVDPPQIGGAREKADAVLRELEKQVTWLRS